MKQIKGYVILPCFKVETAEGSRSAELVCHPVLQKIFELFFLPFWDGCVVVKTEDDEE